MLTNDDEQPHAPGSHPHWQESYLFDWFDAEATAFGIVRLGWRANEKRADAMILSIRNGKVEFLYPGVNKRIDISALRRDAADSLEIGPLRMRMVEPFGRWHIEFDSGKSSMALTFDAASPAFDFGPQYRMMGADPAASGEHFEQTGTISGWTNFKGRRIDINGASIRDKSWGVRDYANLAGWNWIPGLFGTDLAFEATQIMVDGAEPLSMGFVYRDGQNYAIEHVDVDFTWGDREHVAAAARIEITDEAGHLLDVYAKPNATAPLYMRGAWVQESPTELTLAGEGPPRTGGLGVIEHVWRPSALASLRQVPEFLPMLRAALLR